MEFQTFIVYITRGMCVSKRFKDFLVHNRHISATFVIDSCAISCCFDSVYFMCRYFLYVSFLYVIQRTVTLVIFCVFGGAPEIKSILEFKFILFICSNTI